MFKSYAAKLLFLVSITLFSNTYATCVVNGLFDQLCTTTEEADPCNFSTLIWKAEFSCYKKYGVCSANENTCGWQQSNELIECIQGYHEKLVLMDTYTD